jgi:hypothetical protein
MGQQRTRSWRVERMEDGWDIPSKTLMTMNMIQIRER